MGFRTMRPPRAIFLALLSALLLTIGCRSGGDSDAVRVGVRMPTSATPIARVMRLAIEQAARENGIDLAWRDGDDRDPLIPPAEKERIDAIELLVDEAVDVLIYSADDPGAAAEILRRAREARVPVVALDAIPRGFAVDAFVTTDDVRAGEEAARAALDAIAKLGRRNVEGQINALVVEGSFERESDRDVATGFYNVLDADPTVRVVGRAPASNPTEAFRFVSRELNNYAGNVQLLLIAATDYVSGAILAARTHGFAGWLVSASVGAGEEACRLILEGVHDFEVDTMPAQRAVLALAVARRLALGEPLTPDGLYRNGRVEVPVFYGPRRIISKENVSVMSELWPQLYPE